jgi:hypothetical protein
VLAGQVGENAAGHMTQARSKSHLMQIARAHQHLPQPMFPLRKMNHQQERIGNVYSVHNNLPYAEKLANGQVGKGGSKQTGGPGWVQGIAKDVQGRVRKAADDIGRNS